MAVKRKGKPAMITPLEDRCVRIRERMEKLQGLIGRAEKKSVGNDAWRELLSSVVRGMNEALSDLEKRLDHIEAELREYF